MATETVTLQLGNSPKLEATVKVTPTINSSNQVIFTCDYTLKALSSPSYWGYGVTLLYRLRKYKGEYGDWQLGTTIIPEGTNTWSAKTGKITATLSNCSKDTNAYIQLRLHDVGADHNTTYTAQEVSVDVVKLNVAKGGNIFSVSKSPNQAYHLAGDNVTINCILDSADGYQVKFNKWTSDSDCTPNKGSQKSTFAVTDTEEVTLTASATKTPNSGYVFYHPNGGVATDDYGLTNYGDYTNVSTEYSEFTYEDVAKNLWNVATLFEKTGYHAKSDAQAWRLGSATSTTYLNQASQDMSSFVKDKTDVRLIAYANWVANSYTIKYNGNGGNGSMSNTSCTYDKSVNLTANAFTRDGYEFLGWATSATGSVVYKNGASVKNLTSTNNGTFNLYAVWQSHKGKVYYHPNGGSAASGYPLQTSGEYSGFSATTNDVTYEDTKFNLWNVTSLFSRPGYHVPSDTQAWRYNSPTSATYFNQATQNFSSYLKSTDNVVFKLYANWTPNTYKVVYNPNFEGWEDSYILIMAPSNCTYDKSFNLSANTMVRPGYRFKGWSTTPNGTVKYADKASVKNLTTTNEGTVNLYAVWEVDNVCYYGVEDDIGVVTHEIVLVHYCDDGISYKPCLVYGCDEVTEGWKRTGI